MPTYLAPGIMGGGATTRLTVAHEITNAATVTAAMAVIILTGFGRILFTISFSNKRRTI